MNETDDETLNDGTNTGGQTNEVTNPNQDGAGGVHKKGNKLTGTKSNPGTTETGQTSSSVATTTHRHLRSASIPIRAARDQIERSASTLAARITEARELLETDMSDGAARHHAACLLAMERGLQEAVQVVQAHLTEGLDAVTASAPEQQDFLYESLTAPLPGMTKQLRLRDHPPPAELLQIAAEHRSDLRTVRQTLEDEERASVRSSQRGESEMSGSSLPSGDVHPLPSHRGTVIGERPFQAAAVQQQLIGPVGARRNDGRGERMASPVMANVANILRRRTRAVPSVIGGEARDPTGAWVNQNQPPRGPMTNAVAHQPLPPLVQQFERLWNEDNHGRQHNPCQDRDDRRDYPDVQAGRGAQGGPPPGRYRAEHPTWGTTTFETVRLQPPTFSGRPEDWTTFWAYFQRAVDEKPIPGYEKQLHLLRCLKEGSPARRAVEVYPPSDGNYPIVVQLLRERFGDTDDLQRAIRAQLLHMPPAKDNVSSLTATIDEFERGICQLEQLGANVDDASFGPLLESKLPVRILTDLRIREGMSGAKWAVREFRRAVAAQVRCMRSAESALAALKGPERKMENKPETDRTGRGAGTGREQFHRAFLVRDGQPGQQPYAKGHSKGDGPPNRSDRPGNNLPNSRPSGITEHNYQPPGVNGTCSLCQGEGHRPSECRKYATAQSRRQRLIEQGRCLCCLASGHNSAQCHRPRQCRWCQRKDHHTLICWNRPAGEGKPSGAPQNQTSPSTNRAMLLQNATMLNGDNQTPRATRAQQRRAKRWAKAQGEDEGRRGSPDPGNEQRAFAMVGQQLPANLMICSVIVAAEGDGAELKTTLLFDPGSHVNCAEISLVQQLKPVPTGRRPLVIQVFGGRKERIKSATCRLQLKRTDGQWESIEVSTVPQICTPIKTELVGPGTNGGGGILTTTVTTQPQILIGIRKFWDYVVSFRKSDQGAYLIDTVFGTVICGEHFQAVCGGQPTAAFSVMPCGDDERAQMPPVNAVEQFWSLEAIGIRDDPTNDADSAAVIQFEQSVRQEDDGRYSIRLPWRESHPVLPNNFSIAYRRLATMLQRLQRMPDVLKQYSAVIDEQRQNGIIEETVIGGSPREHFIPHQAVITPKKLRVVYDASAHAKGAPSLNDCLLRGPVWLPDLAGMLLRFRACRVPVIADVEKAFLMVAVEEEDRDVCKFLWVRDPAQPLTTTNLVTFRFRRLAFGLTPSPFCLAAVVRHHLRKYDSGMAEQLIRDTYVDNVLIPAESVEEAEQKAREAKRMFADARMNLREFLSNNKALNDSFAEADFLGKTTVKVLGVEWDAENDDLQLRYPEEPPGSANIITRRGVLSTISSLFDPLGLLTPATLRAKLFFQKLWDSTHEWDSPLEGEEMREWQSVLANWEGATNTIPRRVPASNSCPLELHVFCDASEVAFAAAAYLRLDGPNGVESRLIMSKSRLKPKKAAATFTIPRMELMGILLGVRLTSFVKAQLHWNVMQDHLWSDSMIALHWVRNQTPQPQFVANRLHEIRRATATSFHHVPTGENPADLATRGLKPAELQKCLLWWRGPEWLYKRGTPWPRGLEFKMDTGDLGASPTANEDEMVLLTQMGTSPEGGETPFLSSLLNRCGSWSKARRATAWMNRFVKSVRERIQQQQQQETGTVERTEQVEQMELSRGDPKMGGKRLIALQSDELQHATWTIIRAAQRHIRLPGDVRTELDDNFVQRLISRIGRCDETEISRPVILPKKSRVGELIIDEVHVQFHHAGSDGTLAEFLRGWWTPGARQQVRRVLGKCRRCRRMRGAAYPLPLMPPLPADRVQRRMPFESVGLDYLGPTVTFNDSGQRQKAWVLLITCLTTRAIYIDATRDMSAPSFISVLRRFIARRGAPSRILSDNAPTFTVVGKALADFGIENGNPIEFADRKGIQWRFTPQHTPWAGGIFERAVQLVKRALQKTLGGTVLDYDSFSTLLAEIEATVNSRPLTYVNTAAGEPIPLRPIDFLQENNRLCVETPALPPAQRKEPPHVQLTRQWRDSQQRLEHFWQRWHREYLVALREKAGWAHPARRVTAQGLPKIGNVVLIEDKFHPRNLWPVGRIVELKGSGGQIRSVMIRMANGRIWGRPINKICPLEEAPGDHPDAEARADGEEQIQAVPAPANVNPQIQNDSFVAGGDSDQRMQNDADRTTDISAVSKKGVTVPPEGAQKMINSTVPNSLRNDETKYLTDHSEPLGVPYHPTEFQPNRSHHNGEDAFGALTPAAEVQAVQTPVDASANPEALPGGDLRPIPTQSVEEASREPVREVQAVHQEVRAVREGQTRRSNRNRKSRQIWSPEMKIHRKREIGKPGIGLGLIAMLMCAVGSLGCQPSIRSTPVVSPSTAMQQPTVPCSMHCSARGVSAFSHRKLDKLEICCPDGCWAIIPKSSEVSYELPAEELIHGYHCDGKCWWGLGPPFNVSQRCPARDECDLINCAFCWEQLANPTCNPTWSSALLGLGLALILAVLGCICPILSQFWSGATLFSRAVAWGAQYPIRLINWGTGRRLSVPTTAQVEQKVRNGAKMAREEISEVQRRLKLARRARAMARAWRHPDRERGAYPGGAMTALIPLLLILGSAIADKPLSVMVRSEDCSRTAAGLKCAGTAATILTLLPADQINSFVIRTPQDELLGAVRLRLASISMLCVAKTESWLRSYAISTMAVKRCPSAGSCRGNTCNAVRNGAMIPELVALNHRPGHSFCMRSTSFWHNSCGLPSAACLFYRWAAVPTTPTVFEEFSCLEWDLQISAWVELETNKGQVESHRLTIHPGIPEQWGNMTIAVIPTSLPPLPALSAHFVTNGRAVAMCKPIPSDLHCQDEATARDFDKCRLSIGACQKCAPDHDNGTVHCHCRDLEINRVLEDPEQQLPLDVARLHLHNHGPNVRAEFQYSPVQVHIQLNGLELVSEYDNTKCWVEQPKLSGCYRCVTGATFNATCRTDYGMALAKVKCTDGTLFALHCGGNGTTTTESIPFERAEVFTECQVKCPAGSTTFRLQGELVFIPRQQQFGFNNRDSIGGKIEPGSAFSFPEWGMDPFPLFRLLMSGPWLLMALGAGGVGLIALYLFIKFNPHFRIYRALLAPAIVLAAAGTTTACRHGRAVADTITNSHIKGNQSLQHNKILIFRPFFNSFLLISALSICIGMTRLLQRRRRCDKHICWKNGGLGRRMGQKTHPNNNKTGPSPAGKNIPSHFQSVCAQYNMVGVINWSQSIRKWGWAANVLFIIAASLFYYVLCSSGFLMCEDSAHRTAQQADNSDHNNIRHPTLCTVGEGADTKHHIIMAGGAHQSTKGVGPSAGGGSVGSDFCPPPKPSLFPLSHGEQSFYLHRTSAITGNPTRGSNTTKASMSKEFANGGFDRPAFRSESGNRRFMARNDLRGISPGWKEKPDFGDGQHNRRERLSWAKSLPPQSEVRTVAMEVEQLGVEDWGRDPWGRSRVEEFLRSRERNGLRMVHERSGAIIPTPFILGHLPARYQLVAPGWTVAKYYAVDRQRPLQFPSWPCVYTSGGVVGSSRKSRQKQVLGWKPWRFGEIHSDWAPLEVLYFRKQAEIDADVEWDGAPISQEQIGTLGDKKWDNPKVGTLPAAFPSSESSGREGEGMHTPAGCRGGRKMPPNGQSSVWEGGTSPQGKVKNNTEISSNFQRSMNISGAEPLPWLSSPRRRHLSFSSDIFSAGHPPRGGLSSSSNRDNSTAPHSPFRSESPSMNRKAFKAKESGQRRDERRRRRAVEVADHAEMIRQQLSSSSISSANAQLMQAQLEALEDQAHKWVAHLPWEAQRVLRRRYEWLQHRREQPPAPQGGTPIVLLEGSDPSVMEEDSDEDEISALIAQSVFEEEAKKQAEQDEKRWERRAAEAVRRIEQEMADRMEEARERDEQAEAEREARLDRLEQQARHLEEMLTDSKWPGDAEPTGGNARDPNDGKAAESREQTQSAAGDSPTAPKGGATPRLVIDDSVSLLGEDEVEASTDSAGGGYVANSGRFAIRAESRGRIGNPAPKLGWDGIPVFSRRADGKLMGRQLTEMEENEWAIEGFGVPGTSKRPDGKSRKWRNRRR